MKSRAARLIATWFGCGYSPIAPGTAGSLAALAIAWPLVRFAGWQPLWFLAPVLVLTGPGIWAAGVTARESQQKDPGFVVVDEVLGQWLALAGAHHLNLQSWIAAFVLFRSFDIWKPPPVRQLEALPGGTGIVADDLMAGIYSALILAAASRIQIL
jgi:phosphatidylglycerophosphatase A